MIVEEPPLRRFLAEGRAVAKAAQVVVANHQRTCPCIRDRELLAYALGASPECDHLPPPISLDSRKDLPYLVAADLEQLQHHATVMLRQGSVPRPPVPSNLVALVDIGHPIYIRPDKIEGRAEHRLIGNAWVIKVNRQLWAPAQRFATMAEGFKILVETEQLELASNGDPALDWLAGKWAAMLLMPERWVRDIWQATDGHVARTAAIFGVSSSAMRIRLRELDLLGCEPKG